MSGKLLYSMICILAMLSSSSFAQSVWECRNPLPQGNDLNKVAFINNQFIAVGDNGTILSSHDGSTWAKRASGTKVDLKSVTYGKNQFIAVGYNSTILSSPDGVTWTERFSEISEIPWEKVFYSVTYGNNQFVAVKDDGTILSSPDGITWTERFSEISKYEKKFYSVTYGNNLFVAVGDGDDGTIFSSPDGVTWTKRVSEVKQAIIDVIYGNNQFIAVADYGIILTSPDGVKWTSRSGSSDLICIPQSVTYGNNQLIAVGHRGEILSSPDGLAWTEVPYGIKNVNLKSVTYGNGRFVAVGYDGIILSSLDGTTWTEKSAGIRFGDDLTSVTYGNNQFITFGHGYDDSHKVLSSPDGVTWTERSYGTGYEELIYFVTYGNNQFVALGRRESDGIFECLFRTSTDGIIWAEQVIKSEYLLNSVTYGNNQFIAVGTYGQIFSSPDGTTWTERYRSTRTIDLRSVTYGNGQFIAVGWNAVDEVDNHIIDDGIILTSTDGATWTVRYKPNGAGHLFSSVTYGNNQFVVVGERWAGIEENGTGNSYDGVILTSPDGVTWTKRRCVGDGINGTRLSSVTYGNNQFVAVGIEGIIFISTDGATLTERSIRTEDFLVDVIYGNGQFVAVGVGGKILSSKADNTAPINKNPPKKSNNSLRITPVSKRLFIQMPHKEHFGKDLRISLFNAAGKTVYTTNMKMTNVKFDLPIDKLSRGVYLVKITGGKSFEYSGSVAIIR